MRLERASWPPALAGLVALVVGYVALVLATIAVGFVLVEFVLYGWVARTDNGVNHWLADHRTPLETDLSWVGSHFGEAVTIIVLGAVVAIILCVRRRFLAAIFLVVAIVVEGATYEATVQVIDRHRPRVVRLDHLGSGASYPSGHVAASVVIYVGIAMIVFAYTRNRAARWVATVFAILGPLAVAVARMYRGMHHPIDVMSGALMGLGCLAVGLLVARVIGTVSERRRAEQMEEATP